MADARGGHCAGTTALNMAIMLDITVGCWTVEDGWLYEVVLRQQTLAPTPLTSPGPDPANLTYPACDLLAPAPSASVSISRGDKTRWYASWTALPYRAGRTWTTAACMPQHLSLWTLLVRPILSPAGWFL